ncbi:hypothetical protein PENTCL1PPCAC_9789, partial [Pristionchus entomophagus]
EPSKFQIFKRNSTFIPFILVDECATHPCSVHGVCVRGECECDRGWYGVRCTLFSCDFDVECQNGGTCNSGKCECAPDWFGDECDYERNDPCSGFCQNDGFCSKDAVGSPHCKCLDGWDGDRCDDKKEQPVSMANLFISDQLPISSIVNFAAVDQFSSCGWVKPFSSERAVILTVLGEQSEVSLTTEGIEIRTKKGDLWTLFYKF